MRTTAYIITLATLIGLMTACNHTNKQTASTEKDSTVPTSPVNLVAEKPVQTDSIQISKQAIPVFKVEEDGTIHSIMPTHSFESYSPTDSLQLMKSYKVPYFEDAEYQIEVYEDRRCEGSIPRITIRKGDQEMVDMLNGCDFTNWERIEDLPGEEYVQFVPLSEKVVLAFFTTFRDGSCEASPGNVTIVALTQKEAKLVFCEALDFDKFNLTPEHFRLTLTKGCLEYIDDNRSVGTVQHYTLWQEGNQLMFREDNPEVHS